MRVEGREFRVEGDLDAVQRHHQRRLVETLLTERGFFIDNLLVRIHQIIEIILADRPGAMGV